MLNERTETMRARLALCAGLLAVSAARLLAIPRSHWELDEWLFRMGVETFAPLEHHPHPPGYPLLIGLGKAVNLAVGDPFVALVTLATVSSILTYLALADAFSRISGDVWVGIAGALLFSLSPAMMVHSTTPMSDPPALLFLALALGAGARLTQPAAALGRGTPHASAAVAPGPHELRPTTALARIASRWRDRSDLLAPIVFGASLSASIGCRPQYAVALVPTLFAGCLATRSRRSRAAAVGAFTGTSVAWLAPLVVATAGWRRFLDYQATQIGKVAAQDATLARGSRSWLDLGQRFLFDGWGTPAWASVIIALALCGLVLLLIRRRRAAVLLLAMAAIHLAFTLLSSDPEDGVRYALPTQMATAFLAAVAIGVGSRVTPFRRSTVLGVVAIVAAISLRYTWPVLDARRTTPSPPVQAAVWARENLPPRSVVLPDPALRPHADLLMTQFRRFRQHEGLARFWNRPKVPVYAFAEGPTEVEDAVVFAWPDSDAYARLTRNHYRVVSLQPIVPGRRYREVEGLYVWERVPHRREWRWLAPTAKLEIPPGTGPLELELELSGAPLYPRTTVELFVDGVRGATIAVERGSVATVCVPVPAQGALLTIRSSQSFVPAEIGRGRDQRRLGVQLLDLRRRPDLDSANDGVSPCAAQERAS